MPISQPSPNSPPSVKRVEAFTYTAAESTAAQNASAAAASSVTMASLWPVEWAAMCAGRVLHAVHDLYGQDVIQKFGVEILRPGGRAGNDGRGAGAEPKLHLFTGQTRGQRGQERFCNVPVNQANLGGVAHGRTARFRVVYDVQGFLQVGGRIHINMADTRACFDAGHLGAVHAGRG